MSQTMPDRDPDVPPATGAGAGRRWTPAQQQAIRMRGTILVSAAAGAGKTSVLVERIIRRLLDPREPVEIDRLLVVTFTEAAATEMKERIRNRLEEALAERPQDARLRRQLALLGRASISTLHSFCLRLARQYFYRLGLDPATRVAGEHEAQLLRYEVLDEVFERRYAEASPAFLDLVEAYGGTRGDEDLRQLVLRLYDSAYARPWPEAWLRTLPQAYRDAAAALEASDWFAVVRDGLVRSLQRHVRTLEGLAAQCRQPGGPIVWEETLTGDAARLQALAEELQGAGWEGVRCLVQAAAEGWPRLPNNPNSKDPSHSRVRKGRDKVKRALRDLAQGLWTRPGHEVAADLGRIEPYVATLVDLCEDFARSLQAAKRDRGLMDFTDMEHYALRVLLDPEAPPGELRPSPVARELRRFFQEVLVDEYQDINPLQDAILQLVTGDGSETPANLFMVGDVKQSIYAFRQAEPGLFLARYRRYRPLPPEAESPREKRGDAPDGQGWRIGLNANFRSRPAVLAAVNDLFQRIMVPGLGGLAYDDEALLWPGAPYPALPPGARGGEAPVEVHLLERKPEALGDEWPERLEGGAAEPGAGIGTGPEGGGSAQSEGAGAGAAGPVASKAAGAPLLAMAGEERGEASAGATDRDGAEDEAEEATEGDPAGEGDGTGEEVDLTALEQEARLVARRLKELVEGGPGQGPLAIWDPEQRRYRPVRYRDVVVLLRSARLRASTFAEVLSNEGVPVYTRSRTGYLVAPEVEVMLALLQVLDNPRQDIPLAAVLRSWMVGLEARDLARIRLAGRRISFYEAACRVAGWDPDREQPAAPSPDPDAPSPDPAGPDPDDPLARRLRRFLADIARWRTLARRHPLSRVIQQIYDETGVLSYVAGLPGGAQRRANLEALRDRARQFDQFARQGLFRFLRFIDRLRERGDDLGTAPALGENDDVVRVMTIHQSKGLEFPVVVVADLGARFQFATGHALIHRRQGLGLKVVDPELRIRYPSLAYEAVRTQDRLDTLAEELRILYVALTRARERLILVGSVQNLPAAAASWWATAGGPLAEGTGPLPVAALEGAASYLDWLGPALMLHPDAGPLRVLAGVPSGPSGDRAEPEPGSGAASGWSSRWHWSLWLRPPAAGDALPVLAPGDVEPPAGEAGGAGSSAGRGPDWLESLVRGEPLPADAVDGAAVEALRRRLAWRYPYAGLANRFAKRSVSELKGQADPEWQAYPVPAELRRGLREPRLGWEEGAGPGQAGAEDAAGGRTEPEPAGRPPTPSGSAAAAPSTAPGTPAVQPGRRAADERPGDGRSAGQAVTGAARGTATHRVLQHLDLAGPLNEEDLARQVEAMVVRGLLTRAEAAAVDVAALARFFQGPLGRRLRARPERVHREWMFTLGVPAGEMYPDLGGGEPDGVTAAPAGASPAAGTAGGTASGTAGPARPGRAGGDAGAGERGGPRTGAAEAEAAPEADDPTGDLVVVQGIVDCFVEEEDGLLLLDFKTDEPRQQTIAQLAAFYAAQVRFYRRALEAITGRPVKEAYLYFLATDEAVPVR